MGWGNSQALVTLSWAGSLLRTSGVLDVEGALSLPAIHVKKWLFCLATGLNGDPRGL